jgi:hypothetical protein
VAIEETLRLKVELDQSELGSELASIRTSVSSAASVQPEASVSAGGNGGHPTQRDSIFWGLGAAAQQMTGDITSAASYANNVVATSLQTGAAVSQAFSGTQSFSPGYISPTGNAPVQMGFGGALSQSIFGGNAAPSMSENQSDAMASQYWGNRFSGLGGAITGAQTGQAFASAGGFWAGAAIGGAIGNIPGAIIGGIAGTVLGETVLSGGTRRLEDIQTLTGLGMSRSAAQNVMGGGYWDGVGDSLSTGFGLFDYSKDHLAGAFQDGMEINGRTYKGAALAGVLLDKGLGDMTASNLSVGQLGMNALVTRTGMGMGDAAEYMKSISGAGSQGIETLSAVMGMLGTGNEVGMNTRFQNQIMGGMMQSASNSLMTQGHSAAISAGANYAAAGYSLADNNPEMRGVNSAVSRIGAMGDAGTGFSRTAYGQGTMAMAAAYMTVNGLDNVHDALLEMEKGGWDRGTLMTDLRGMGTQAIYTFSSNLNLMNSADPLEKAKILMNTIPRNGRSDKHWAEEISFRSGATRQAAEDLVTGKQVTEGGIDAYESTHGYLGDGMISTNKGWWGSDKQYENILSAVRSANIYGDDLQKAEQLLELKEEIQRQVDKDNRVSNVFDMSANELKSVNTAKQHIDKLLASIAPNLTSGQQKELGIQGLAGGSDLKGALINLSNAASAASEYMDSEAYDNRE